MNWNGLILERWPEIQSRLTEHLVLLTLAPVVLAILLGLPLGIVSHRSPKSRNFIMALVGMTQTIPSLAMLALMLPILGIGKPPAIAALTLYALLPITQNTLVGLDGTPRSTLKAARGLGFSAMQCLFRVELPLAFPVILGGIRTATVTCVGVATLSTFIGAGGLGDFISRGLSLNNIPLLCLGAGSAAFLALGLDGTLEALSHWAQPGRKKPLPMIRKVFIGTFVLALSTIYLYSPNGNSAFNGSTAGNTSAIKIRIGSKNFTEQMVLAEILAQQIERATGFEVERVFNLGGTIICHNALIHQEIDLYVEYTGTAYTAILKEEFGADMTDHEVLLDKINRRYKSEFQCEFLDPLGFNNTYAIMAKRDVAASRNWKTISDLKSIADTLTVGFNSEFSEREDGYPGLAARYGFQFGSVKNLAPELMYQAVREGRVDLICGFSTDGKIPQFDLTILRDDLDFFPPYQAVPVVRLEVLEQYPEIREALNPLAGAITDAQMQILNQQAESGDSSIPAIAEAFLNSLGAKPPLNKLQ
jgi:osmoprotectant transport system permease protein